MQSNQRLDEQVSAITNVPVSTARANLNSEYRYLEDRLSKLTLQMHGALLQMLQSAFAVRQESMRDAMAEHQYQAQLAQKAAQDKAVKDLERQQAEVQATNQQTVEQAGPELVTQ